MQPLLRVFAVGAVFAVVFSGIRLSAQGTDLRALVIGTWELNVAKSKYSPGPPPKSQVRTYEVVGQGLKYTAKVVDAEGRPGLEQWTGSYDGNDYALTGLPDFDMQAVKAVDAFNSEFTLKKAGKVVMTGTRGISKDGKVMTVTVKGTNAKGQAVTNVMVFAKR